MESPQQLGTKQPIPPSPAAFKFNPLDPAFHQDPYPTYQRLRTEDPIHRNFFGSWVLTRYGDVKAILQDSRIVCDNLPERIRSKNPYLEKQHKDLNALARITSKWLLYLEPPDHTRLRRLVGKVFSPATVEKLRPKIQTTVDNLFSQSESKGQIDIITDLARPLPVLVIAEMLGIPADCNSEIFHWANEVSEIFDPLNSLETFSRMNEIVIQFEQMLRQIVEERERQPQADLISELIAARDEGDKLTTEELISVCMLLFGTGEETTVNLIGNGVLALLKHPDQLERLREDPSLIQSAVEELLRYESPVQAISRIAVEDIELQGKTIKSGQQVIVYLGAANRDPDQFPQPDQLDIARPENRHLAFAEGIHYCLGAFLARAEGQIAIKTLVQRFPQLHLLAPNPRWRKNISLRGLETLPISWVV